MVYTTFTSDDPDYGCLSSLCLATECNEPLEGIGQDPFIIETHRFCKGVWKKGDEYLIQQLEMMGGMRAVQKACATAAAQV